MVISPAKTLDFDSAPVTDTFTEASFLNQSQQLIDDLKLLSADDVKQLMKVSDNIAELNVTRFNDWQRPFTPQTAKQAVLSFKGDVYQGLSADTLAPDQLTIAQDRLRILSGLYGLLKPLDLIQPYRLEMGTKFANKAGPNLYKFWGDTLVDALNAEMGDDDLLVNLASNEYFKALPKKKIKAKLITPEFKDFKNGEYKMISFYAKKARGMMVRYLLETDAKTEQDILGFDYEGYRYNEELSGPNAPTFTRKLVD